MTDRLDNLKNAKCLVEAWEQKYGIGGHHSKWVNLRPSDIEWAVAEIERLLLAEKALIRQIRWNNDCVDAYGLIICPNPESCACEAEARAMMELEGK